MLSFEFGNLISDSSTTLSFHFFLIKNETKNQLSWKAITLRLDALEYHRVSGQTSLRKFLI